MSIRVRIVSLVVAAALALAGHAAVAPCADAASAVPAQLTSLSAGTLTANGGEPFARRTRVLVGDDRGNPVASVLVRFTIVPDGSDPAAGDSAYFQGEGSSVLMLTAIDGSASTPTLVAGSPGDFAIRVDIPSAPSIAPYLQTASVGQPIITALVAQSGAEQVAPAGGVFAEPLVARATGVRGTAIAPTGAAIVFSIGPSATFAGGASEVTVPLAPDGTAVSPRIAAGPVPETLSVNAWVTGVDDSTASMIGFALYIVPAEEIPIPGSLLPFDEQYFTTPGTAFATSVDVVVNDTVGHTLSDVDVRFTIVRDASTPQAGASASFAGGGSVAFAVTDTYGLAAAPTLIAGVAGKFSVVVDVPSAPELGTLTLQMIVSPAFGAVAPPAARTPAAPPPASTLPVTPAGTHLAATGSAGVPVGFMGAAIGLLAVGVGIVVARSRIERSVWPRHRR